MRYLSLASSISFRFTVCGFLETDSKRLLRPSEDVPADEGATEF